MGLLDLVMEVAEVSDRVSGSSIAMEELLIRVGLCDVLWCVCVDL